MITTIDELQNYLDHAMQIEHATIPPYLLALYSIRPETNLYATKILKTIAVEEMLHLTLAANLLNAVGGKPNLTVPGFVPEYPAYLPDGEDDFQVALQAFSKEAIETFLKIERPEKPSTDKKVVQRHPNHVWTLAVDPANPGMRYFSIGEFYEEIRHGLEYLQKQEKRGGPRLFTGARQRQVTFEHYYSGGGKLFPATDIDSACDAVDLIIEQGEGYGGGIYNKENELAHYYRFQELMLCKQYQKGDKPDHPTGENLTVSWDAVYPIKKNTRLSDYTESSELHAKAVAFNKEYAIFLALLTTAFNGMPELLEKAVWRMMSTVRDKMNPLIRNPIPGRSNLNGAPTFEI
jgi:hypothetical protein